MTPDWIHWWLWNDAQNLKQPRRGALLFFKVIHQISRSRGTNNCRFWPEFFQNTCFTLKFEYSQYDLFFNGGSLVYVALSYCSYLFLLSSKLIVTGRFCIICVRKYNWYWIHSSYGPWCLEKVCLTQSFSLFKPYSDLYTVQVRLPGAVPWCHPPQVLGDYARMVEHSCGIPWLFPGSRFPVLYLIKRRYMSYFFSLKAVQ